MKNQLMPDPHKRLSTIEFTAMLALFVSMAAMSVDMMLPAIRTIGADLGATGSNAPQYIISASMFGLAAGQLFYGPLSDSWGRRPVTIIGFCIFTFGTVLCIFAWDFNSLIFGRLLQGLGAAGPRVIAMSIIRDVYVGRQMARIVSIMMGVFIIIVTLAPAIGQTILVLSGWRFIFISLLFIGLLALIWFLMRQGETLAPENKRAFSIGSVSKGFIEVANIPASLWHTVATGIIFGAFYGLIMTSPQIFADNFGITTLFPFYFGALVLFNGLSTMINSKLVMKFGMQHICTIALIVQFLVSSIFLLFILNSSSAVSLKLFMFWGASVFFVQGFLFGNLNAIAMEPVGHLAGTGAAFVASLSTALAVLIGTIIGQLYNTTIIPLVSSFAILALVSLLTMRLASSKIQTTQHINHN